LRSSNLLISADVRSFAVKTCFNSTGYITPTAPINTHATRNGKKNPRKINFPTSNVANFNIFILDSEGKFALSLTQLKWENKNLLHEERNAFPSKLGVDLKDFSDVGRVVIYCSCAFILRFPTIISRPFTDWAMQIALSFAACS